MDMFHAFVLNSLDYKDSSKILYLYTKTGQKSVIAHRVKKLNSINRFLSQNGTLIKLSTTKGDFPSLKEGELVDEFEHIKQDIIAYSYMNHIMELVRNVVDDHANHEKIFKFLYQLFKNMNAGADPEIISFIFELKLLYLVGYGLNFSKCNICEDNDNLVFNVSSGGLVCQKHLDYNQEGYGKEIYNLLSDLYFINLSEEELPNLTDNHKSMIRHIIDMLYDEFVSFKSKSLAIIKQIKKY